MNKIILAIFISTFSILSLADTTYRSFYETDNNRQYFKGPNIFLQENFVFGNIKKTYSTPNKIINSNIDYTSYLIGLGIEPISTDHNKLSFYYKTDLANDADSNFSSSSDFDTDLYGLEFGSSILRNKDFLIIGYKVQKNNNNSNYKSKESLFSLKYEINAYPTDLYHLSFTPAYYPIIKTDLEQSFGSLIFDSEIDGKGYGLDFEITRRFFKNSEASLSYSYLKQSLDGKDGVFNLENYERENHVIGTTFRTRF